MNKLLDITKNLGMDGKRVEAFFKDWVEDMSKMRVIIEVALGYPDSSQENIQSIEDKAEEILQIPYILIATALKGAKSFSLWRPSSWDVLRPMRILAKDVAVERNYTRYLDMV